MAHGEKCKACGNWFNTAVYKTCPYCGQEIIGEAEVKQTEKREEPIKGVKKAQKNKKHNWWRGNRAGKEEKPAVKKWEKEVKDEPKEEKTKINEKSDGETVTDLDKVPDTKPLHSIDQKDAEVERDLSSESPIWPAETDIQDYEKNKDESEEVQISSLAQSIERAGKTVGRWVEKKDGECIQPVVGWLVGVKGAYYGQDFKLKNGKNSISRSADADIKLIHDESVSRKTIATIIYDSKGGIFSIISGESDSLCYVNQKPVYGRVELTGYEEIEFGDSELNKFVFVPFCGKQFRWPRIKTEEI